MTFSRQMTLVAFLQAQNCSNYPGSWRHESSMSDFLSPRVLPARRPHSGRRQVPDGVFRRSVWRSPTSMATTIPPQWRTVCAR